MGWIPPGCTELSTEKLPRSEGVNDRLPGGGLVSRSSNSTSEGELTLVGTWGVEKVGGPLVRPTSESLGKTRYTSTRTSPISATVAPPVSNPTNVALLITVSEVKKKSSPVSISNFPADEGRDAVAILPSGSPVLKMKGSAAAGTTQSAVKAKTVSSRKRIRTSNCTKIRWLSPQLCIHFLIY